MAWVPSRTGKWVGVLALVLGALHAAAIHGEEQAPALEVGVVARAIQPGEVVRVDVTCVCGADTPRATAFDRDIPLSPSPDRTSWHGFIGIDLDVAPGRYPLLVEVSGRQPALDRRTVLRVRAKQFVTRALRVAPEFVDPPAPVVDRIVREAALLDRIFDQLTPRAWDRAFALPLTTRPARNFGSRSVFNGQPRNPHAGIDFSSPAGTVVSAPAAGTVALAADLFFTGQTIVVDHGAGVLSLFAHLSSIDVAVGQAVAGGARLGRVGATGRATGPHLHWGVRLNGARVDPLSLIFATQPG